MAIDPVRESLIPLGHVPRLKTLPCRRGGARLHASTIYRWASRGIRGVRLETLQVGGQRVTTARALAEFFERLSATSLPAAQEEPQSRSMARRRRMSSIAERELENLGL